VLAFLHPPVVLPSSLNHRWSPSPPPFLATSISTPHASSPPFFPLLHEKQRDEEGFPTVRLRRRSSSMSTSPLGPAPSQGHQQLRLIVLFIWVQGIEPGHPKMTSLSLFLHHCRRTPVNILATPFLPRPPRPLRRLPGDLFILLVLFPASFPLRYSLPTMSSFRRHSTSTPVPLR
jgi:hypothetical protein